MASESTSEYFQEPPDGKNVDGQSTEHNDNWARVRGILLEWVEDRAVHGQWEKRSSEDVGDEDPAITTLQLALNCANNGAQLEKIATAKDDEHVKHGTCMYEKIKGVYSANASVAAIKRCRRNELLPTVELQHDFYEKLDEKYRAEYDREYDQAYQLVKVWIARHHRQPQRKVEERLSKVIPVCVLVHVRNGHCQHDNHERYSIDEYDGRRYQKQRWFVHAAELTHSFSLFFLIHFDLFKVKQMVL